MKQIDILRHAKDYLEKLDAYTDPISGTRLPSSSAARDEYVHKSFYFSLKHMNHIISYDDTGPAGASRWWISSTGRWT